MRERAKNRVLTIFDQFRNTHARGATLIKFAIAYRRRKNSVMRSREIISIVEVRDSSEIYEKIKKGFELIGIPKFKSNDIVAIKPNLCCIKGPETGATTDPLVVEGIIRYLQNEFKISDISIVESDGTQLLADMAFKLLGYESLSRRMNVKCVNLSKAPFSYKVFD